MLSLYLYANLPHGENRPARGLVGWLVPSGVCIDVILVDARQLDVEDQGGVVRNLARWVHLGVVAQIDGMTTFHRSPSTMFITAVAKPVSMLLAAAMSLGTSVSSLKV